MTGERPDLRRLKTYIFGCEVICLREKEERGPPGSATHGRTYKARYLGFDNGAHIVEKLDTQVLCYPKHCAPVNEAEMVRNSLPAGAAHHSTTSQTSSRDYEPLTRAQPPMQEKSIPRAPAAAKVRQDAYEIGTRLGIEYFVDGKATVFNGHIVRERVHGSGLTSN